ncbi:MAG TPA: hypothetical protein DCR14_00235 [Acidimicrobiaceae bacterium]|nr:hypothetical protein [Acidimicrobiaceae bacterium]
MGQEATVTQPRVQNAVTGQWHQLRVSTVYDANTNPVSVTLADVEPVAPGGTVEPARTMVSEYDLNDRAWRITDPEGNQVSVVFDAVGNVVSQTDGLGRVTTTAYDGENRPTVVTLLGYVDPTAPAAPVDVVLSSTTYDSEGRISTVTDAAGAVVRYAYDPAGRVESRVVQGFQPPSGPPVDVVLDAYQYDQDTGRVTDHWTANGLVRHQYTYTASGQVQTERLHNAVAGYTSRDRVATYVYDSRGRVVTERLETIPASVVLETRTAYDAFGRVASETVENGATDLVTSFGYDQMNRLVATTAPNGAITTNEYDLLGRMVRSVEPARSVVSFGAAASTQAPQSVIGYGAFGDVLQLQQPSGATVSFSYDRNGRQLTKTLPTYVQPGTGTALTPVSSIEYDAAGNVVARVDARGQQTDFVYDTLNRVAVTLHPAPVAGGARPTVRARYNTIGRQVWSEGPTGAANTATYDQLGRMTSSTEVVRNGTSTPDQFTTSYTYDWAGRVTSVTDPEGRTSSQVWSPAGDLLAVTDPDGHTSVNEFNARGQAVRSTDPLGRSTRITYDLAGRAVHSGAFSAAGTEVVGTSYTYDANGNVLSSQALVGPPTTYAYDIANQLTSVTQPVAAGTNIVTSYGYDIAGRPTRTVDGNGSEWWTTYNVWGFEESRIEPATSSHPALADRTFSVAYDIAGAVARTNEPGGVTVVNTFDQLGRLTSQVGGVGATRTFEYDLAGRPTGMWANGTNLAFTYNDRGQLTAASGSGGTSSFTYHPAGALASRTDSVGVTQFNWNNRGLLNSLVDPLTGTSHAYTYNAAGQLTTDVATTGSDTVTRTVSYDAIGRVSSDVTESAGDVLTQVAYTYDGAGNLSSKVVGPAGRAGAGTNSYGYDWAGRLTSWTDPSNTTIGYAYDGNGNLLANGPVSNVFDERNRMVSNGSTPLVWSARGTLASMGSGSYEYDAFGQLVEAEGVEYVYDALGRVVARDGVAFTYSGASMDPSNDGVRSTVFTPGGSVVSTGPSGAASMVVTRSEGEVTDLVAPDGASVSARVFDPWGAPVTGPVAGVGFQSDFTDPDTGLVNMGARWYSPELGEFIARDTYSGRRSEPASLNRYGYGNSSPLDHVDPDGRCAMRYDRNACSSKHTSKVANTAYRLAAAKPSVRKLVDTNMAHESRAQQARAGWTPPSSKSRAVAAKAVAKNPSNYTRYEQQPPPKPTAMFASCELDDSCVMGTNSAIGKLSREWDQCMLSTECGPEELVEALSRSRTTGLGLGSLVFALIDVAKQGDWGKSDGNWSPADVAAAAAGTNIAELLLEQGISGEVADRLTQLVSSVASRLVDHNRLYERLDHETGFWEKLGSWIADNFLTVVSVGLTLASLFTPCTVFCAVASAAVSGIDAVQTCMEAGIGASCAVAFGGAVLDAYGAGKALTKAADAFTATTRLGAGATEAGTPLYRGVATDHHAYDDAVKGIARPGDVNGVSDAALHNAGFTHGTDLTSWSTKLNVAEDFAGPGGVVLETSVEQLQRRGVQILTSPDNFDEAEVLVRGTVCGLATRRC